MHTNKLLLLVVFIFSFLLESQELTTEIINDNLDDLNLLELQKDSNLSAPEEVITTDSLAELPKDEFDDFDKFGFSFFKFTPTSIAPVLDIPLQGDYVLTFNDELELYLTGNNEQKISLRVDLAGNVAIPEFGDISLINKTLNEANSIIGSLVENAYIGTQSYLSVTKPSLKKISIVGEINNPGTYLMNPFITVSEALKFGGGLKKQASLRTIKVISVDGSMEEIDLYEFLVFGKRDNDINLKNGDTLVIVTTNNFVKVNGTNRDKIYSYEYKSNDTFEDIINFSGGLRSDSNANSLNVDYLNTSVNQINTEARSLKDLVGNKYITYVNLGSTKYRSKLKAEVIGSSVSEGYYAYNDGDSLSDLISKLSFDDSIYPFYGEIYQENKEGKEIYVQKFSITDDATISNINLKENPKIYFYSKSEAIKKATDFDNNLFKVKNSIVDLYIGPEHYIVPLAGTINPKQLFDSYNFGYEIDQLKTTASTKSGTISSAFNIDLVTNELLSIFLPIKKDRTVNVEVVGDVANSGIFKLSPNTTINEIYEIVGGFLKSADPEGIILQRKVLKEREKNLIDSSKKILNSLLIENLTTNSGGISVETINSLLLLTEQIAVAGRLSGDFSPNSSESLNTIVQDGDILTVPTISNTVTMIGEVKNQITFSFNDDWGWKDYISAAGGLTDYADKKEVFIIRKNGSSIQLNQNSFSKSNNIMPGDTIVIPRNYSRDETAKYIESITRIISNIAFSAASLNVLNN